jgi:hypothetical protein
MNINVSYFCSRFNFNKITFFPTGTRISALEKQFSNANPAKNKGFLSS